MLNPQEINVTRFLIWGVLFSVGILLFYVSRIIYYGEIDYAKTDQVGDFIGGVIGALASFLSTVLFYNALRLQSIALADQKEELQLAREEYSHMRKQHLINNQIENVKILTDLLKVKQIRSEFGETNSGVNAIDSIISFDSMILSYRDLDERSKKATIYVKTLFSYSQTILDLVQGINVSRQLLKTKIDKASKDDDILSLLSFYNLINPKVIAFFRALERMLKTADVDEAINDFYNSNEQEVKKNNDKKNLDLIEIGCTNILQEYDAIVEGIK